MTRYEAEQLETYYDKFYYETYAYGEAYRRDNPHWQAVFGSIADKIVAEFSPRTVLDAGCGPGVLVEALRARGVDAHGIDISEYAIEHVGDGVRPYCRVASVTEELDRVYDVIVCVEVLEHLPRHLADTAVENLAGHGEVVLFSSTPDDFTDPSHQNVQPAEYWTGLFARHGAFRDLDVDASFISRHAICYRRGRSALEAIRKYERGYTRTMAELREMHDVNVRIVADRASLTEDVERLRRELAALKGETLPPPARPPRIGARGQARRLLPAHTRRGRAARAVYRKLRPSPPELRSVGELQRREQPSLVEQAPSSDGGNLRLKYLPLLVGDGIEIGPLHSPMPLPPTLRVRYVDKFDLEELRRRNPDVDPERIVEPHIVCDSRRLEPLADGSLDFIVASHVLEHLDNPIAGLLEWRRVLRAGGRIFCVVPDGRFTFDRGRPFTGLEHLLWDYVNDGTQSKRLSDLFHIAECNLNLREDLDVDSAVELASEILRTAYESHFHVWSYDSFRLQLETLIRHYGLPFQIVAGASDGSFEMVFVLEAAEGAFTVPEGTVPRAAR